MRIEEGRKVDGGINRNIHYFMHPFSSSYPRLFESGSRLSRVFLASLPSDIFQLFLRNPAAFPVQMRYVIPQASSRSTPRSPSSWTVPNLQRKAPRRPHDQMPEPPQMSPLDYSKLPLDICAPLPHLMWGWAQPHYRETCFSSCIHSVILFCTTENSRPRSRWGPKHRSKAFASAPCSPRRFRERQPVLLTCSCVYSRSASQTSDNCCCIDRDTRQMLMRWKFLQVE